MRLLEFEGNIYIQLFLWLAPCGSGNSTVDIKYVDIPGFNISHTVV